MSASNPVLTHPKYRPDIDGLRAIAVWAVVLFHAFPSLLPGGFVGVDIFFVISGFLISSILFENLERRHFSFSEFYSRRIRRIFPALLTVMLTCYALGWFILPAPEFRRLGLHTSGGAGFFVNFLLLRESGYFDIAAETKPLLHLWSLAIEEQFYVLWPVLAWATWRFRLNRLFVALCIVAASFAVNLHLMRDPGEAARLYYLPQTRFWELMSGAVLAALVMSERYRPIFLQQGVTAELRACFGAGLLAASFACIDATQPFPGVWAVLPVVGTALMISAGPLAWLNRCLLSQRMLVWFGLISFPLYLWHWPLLSFARIWQTETPAALTRIALVFLAVLLAWLTRKFIETPLRFGKLRFTTAALFCAMILVGGIGWATVASEGFPGRYGVPELKMTPGRYECENRRRDSGCAFGNVASGKLVVVWGDSHAEQFTNALRVALGNDYEFRAVTDGSCFMGEHVMFPQIGNLKECMAAIDTLKALHGRKIYAVIRAQRWHGYGLIDKANIEAAVTDAITAYDLQSQKVVILGATPDVDIECEVANYYAKPSSTKRTCKSVDVVKGELRQFAVVTRAMSVPANVRFVYPYEIVCPHDVCPVIEGSTAIFSDIHHLTTEGAMRVIPVIAKALAD